MPFDLTSFTIATGATAVLVAILWRVMPMGRAFPAVFLGPLLVILGFTTLPFTFAAGTALTKQNVLKYNEFWSGLEKSADMRTTTCTKDGVCHHTYSCDPYTVMVTKTRTKYRTVSDGKGGTKTESYTETYTEAEVRYHQCPYVTEERTYTVTDTIGETYTFASHRFPPNPEAHRWRGVGYQHRYLPAISSEVPNGWKAAKARIAAGRPDGTTVRKSYKNYVQAAQQTIYRKHSNSIPTYQKAGLLPTITKEVHDHYRADKVYTVGVNLPGQPQEWQHALSRLNGVFGKEQQGDLHVVFVDAERIPDGNDYSEALASYWQSSAMGRDTLSKNGVVLVLGLEDGKVVWRNAFTGMPEGNELMLQRLRSLEVPGLSPTVLFAQDGALASHLKEFKRVEMKNYQYLEDSIKPTAAALFAIGLSATFLSVATGMCVLALQDSKRFLPQVGTPAWGEASARAARGSTRTTPDWYKGAATKP